MKKKIAVISTLVLFALAGFYVLLVNVNYWFEDHRFIFQSPVTITFNRPIQVVKRELLKPTIIEIVNGLPEMKDLTPIEEYICKKWGPYDCRLALAVFKAESGLREDAFNINSNGTIDYGPAQINSVHWKRQGCSMKELVDQYKNIDCAFEIYKEQGFQPWTVWKNGSFKEKL